jgi:RimJ/RimL family protein N-acetyltransferase
VTSAPALLIRKLPRVPRDNAVRTASPTWTIELVRDRRTREPVAAATMAELKRDLVARGLLPFVVDNRIHVVPGGGDHAGRGAPRPPPDRRGVVGARQLTPARGTTPSNLPRKTRRVAPDGDNRRVQTNLYGQPVGDPVPDWQPRPRPDAVTLTGSYCRLERLDPGRHAGELFAADRADTDGTSWTYLPYGPFDDLESYAAWVSEVSAQDDPYFFAVIDTDPGSPIRDRASGVLSLLRVQPDAGSIEVGHIHLSPALQQTRASTEAQFLIMSYVFDDLGYRRYEWKCDALNAPSRRSAERLGFSYEGIFRQAVVIKGRNRDTAWYAIVDADWPRVREAFRAWLASDNFEPDGRQRASLKAAR